MPAADSEPIHGPAPEWISRKIDGASAQLVRLSQSTEQEFLNLGEKLREILNRSREISQKASDVASQVSGADLAATVQRLQSIHAHIIKSNSGSHLISEQLDAFLQPSQDIPKHLDSLHRTVRILEMTGFLVKIEDARFTNTNTGFSTVAENLQRLCKEIRAKSEELRSRSALIESSLHSGLRVVSKSEQQLNQSTHLILERVLSSLTRLQNKHQSSSGTLQTISSKFQAISKSIGEVIVSLQFHDITRQRIEHAMTALKRLSDSESQGENSAVEAANTCRLQSNQLRHAMKDMLQAVGQIRQNLQSLASDGSAISATTLELAGFDAEKEKSFLSNIEEELISLTRAFDEYQKINKHIVEAVESILNTVRDMSGFATDIGRMGMEMRFVAMNASINAARIGDRGVSLGVLANNAQELAQQTSDDIQVITAALQTILSVAQELSNKCRSLSGMHGDSIEGLKLDFHDTQRQLHAQDRELGATLKEIDGSARALSGDVSASAESMQSPYVLNDEIQSLSDSLETYAAHVVSNLTEEEKKSLHLLENLESGYTMHAEREIHRSYLEGTMNGNGGESDARPPEAAGESELGENVELF